MITLKELCKGHNFDSLPPQHRANLEAFLERLNRIRKSWGHPMSITSGYRSLEEHLRIYKSKGITDQSKIPMKSRHLYGAACDIYDPQQELQKWCLANTKLLEDVGLWCEHFSATPTWVHFQLNPPASGARFFRP